MIEMWRNPQALKIAQSDDVRMSRIREITDEMRHLQEQKNEALRMKLRKEVDAKTFRDVTAEIDAAHAQLTREHKTLASEAAMPELPDPSLAWEDLSSEDRRALMEMLVDKIIVTASPQDRRRQSALHHPRHPVPRSRDGSRAAKGGARGASHDRPQGLKGLPALGVRRPLNAAEEILATRCVRDSLRCLRELNLRLLRPGGRRGVPRSAGRSRCSAPVLGPDPKEVRDRSPWRERTPATPATATPASSPVVEEELAT